MSISDGVYKVSELLPEEAKNLTLERIIALLAYKIAEYPKEARVKIMNSSRLTVLEFDLHPSDRGKFLGSKGHTVRAVLTVAKAILGPMTKSRAFRIDLANDEISKKKG